MATTRDAQYGWELFKESGYALSFAELNDALRSNGMNAVSLRMFQHYHKLFRYGYEEYLPINQLDVKTLQNPVWDAATRNRYALREISIAVKLRLIHRKKQLELEGLATRISDAILVVRLEGVTAEEVAAAKVRAADQRVEVVFPQTGEILTGRIDSVIAETRQRIVIFRISFSVAGSLNTLGIRESLGARSLRVEIHPRQQDIYLADLVQSLYWLFQGIEAARAAGDELLMRLDEEQRFSLPATRVDRLRLESPLQVELIVAAPAILFVLGIVKRLVAIRNDKLMGDVTKQEKEVRKAVARKTNAEALVQERVAERLKKENESESDPLVGQAVHLLRNLLAGAGAGAASGLPETDKVQNVLEGQAEPALLSLLEAAGDAEVVFLSDDEEYRTSPSAE